MLDVPVTPLAAVTQLDKAEQTVFHDAERPSALVLLLQGPGPSRDGGWMLGSLPGEDQRRDANRARTPSAVPAWRPVFAVESSHDPSAS